MDIRSYPIRSKVDKPTKEGIASLAAITLKPQELIVAELLEAAVKREMWSMEQRKRTGRRIERRIKLLTTCVRRLEKEVASLKRQQKPATKVTTESLTK